MVVPIRQVADFQALTLVELAEMMQTIQRAMRALDAVVHPHGYNLGANLGRVAGAGVEHHVHFHIVPRWNGDTNFMPILGNTKVVSEEMRNTLKKLKKAFKNA
jgi:ATP adenylyltransferase